MGVEIVILKFVQNTGAQVWFSFSKFTQFTLASMAEEDEFCSFCHSSHETIWVLRGTLKSIMEKIEDAYKTLEEL